MHENKYAMYILHNITNKRTQYIRSEHLFCSWRSVCEEVQINTILLYKEWKSGKLQDKAIFIFLTTLT